MDNVLEFRARVKEKDTKKEKGLDELFKDVQNANKQRKIKEQMERNARNAAIIKQLTDGKGRSG